MWKVFSEYLFHTKVKRHNKTNTFFSHIDCAPVYLNEKAIGKVLKEWIDAGKVKREDLFITTKLPDYGKCCIFLFVYDVYTSICVYSIWLFFFKWVYCRQPAGKCRKKFEKVTGWFKFVVCGFILDSCAIRFSWIGIGTIASSKRWSRIGFNNRSRCYMEGAYHAIIFLITLFNIKSNA